MTTFTYSPESGASQTTQPRVRVATFGDGYQQRVADGINNAPRTWSLSFRGSTARLAEISAFFEARGGVESFDWTPPYGAAGKFICKSWGRDVTALSAQTINATFEEVFGD